MRRGATHSYRPDCWAMCRVWTLWRIISTRLTGTAKNDVLPVRQWRVFRQQHVTFGISCLPGEVEVGHHLLGDVAMQTFEKSLGSCSSSGKSYLRRTRPEASPPPAREREKSGSTLCRSPKRTVELTAAGERDHRLPNWQEEQAWHEQLNQTAEGPGASINTADSPSALEQ